MKINSTPSCIIIQNKKVCSMKKKMLCTGLLIFLFIISISDTYAQSKYRFRVRENTTYQDYVQSIDVPDWKGQVDEAFIRSFDGIYIPAIIAKPEKSTGKLPVIILLFAGPRGREQLYDQTFNRRGMLAERLSNEGYMICNTGYRAEMDETYVVPEFPAVLDHLDVMAVIEYLKRRDDVDADRIGLYGVSHGGELICKIISEIDLAGGVAVEPANSDFLNYKRSGGGQMEEREVLKDSQIDKSVAMKRIRNINTPVVILNRTNDHLTGMFKKTYLLMKEAGNQCWEWEYEHANHGFTWGPDKRDGEYKPDDIQKEAMEETVKFFNKFVKKSD